MPEDAPGADPATQVEAPEGDAQAEQPAEQTEDFQKRYEDLRSQYDRVQNEHHQFQEFYGQLSNPETQAEALAALGLELQEAEELEPEYEDPDDRISRLEQSVQEQRLGQIQAAQEEAEFEHVAAEIRAIQDSENLAFDEKELGLLYSYADSNRGSDGMPDIQGAYEVLSGVNEAARDRYLKTKKSESPTKGMAGVEKYDLSDPDQRHQALAQAAAEGMAEEE